MIRTRYRYILSGIALGIHEIGIFRLVAANHLGNLHNGSSALRVRIPDDLPLEKLSCDPYSTTTDTRTLDELGYDILLYDEKPGKWVVCNEFKGRRPCDIEWHEAVQYLKRRKKNEHNTRNHPLK